ncbi:MAG: hypothetical protein HY775_09160 [Acidobacteria bacterium]|nr:hypothetical protein [Acidobacteriota bacterium]
MEAGSGLAAALLVFGAHVGGPVTPEAAPRSEPQRLERIAAVDPAGRSLGGPGETAVSVFRSGGTSRALGRRAGGRTPARAKPADRGSKCPAPKTCGLYELKPWRLPADRAGNATIEFLINPDGQQWLSADDAEKAILAATKSWMAANPRIRLVYGGRTTRHAALDEWSVIDWEITGTSEVAVATVYHPGNKVKGADIVLNTLFPWNWKSCEQRDGSCTAVSYPVVRYLDVQAVVTHELGHWLGLQDLGADPARELTMYGEVGTPGERKQSTLGLGDVLGLRAAYPCRCASPRIFAP